MKKEQLRQKFEELLNNKPLELRIWAMFDLVIDSGAISISGESANDYRLSKIILYVILCEIAEQCRPLDTRNREDAENLKLSL